MIEGRGTPVAGIMAVIALITAINVVDVLANGYATIMATDTATQYLAMVNSTDRRPPTGAVTVFTHIAGLNVTGILTRGFSAIMTADTVSSDATMIKSG